MSSSPWSDVVPVVLVYSVPVGVVVSLELDVAVMDSDRSTIMSWFSPLNPPGSPISMVSVDQVVVESPTSHDAPVVQVEIPGRGPFGNT